MHLPLQGQLEISDVFDALGKLRGLLRHNVLHRALSVCPDLVDDITVAHADGLRKRGPALVYHTDVSMFSGYMHCVARSYLHCS